jgi:hypothetical protein
MQQLMEPRNPVRHSPGLGMYFIMPNAA